MVSLFETTTLAIQRDGSGAKDGMGRERGGEEKEIIKIPTI